MICKNYKVIFIHIPKTGGMSITNIFRKDPKSSFNGMKFGIREKDGTIRKDGILMGPHGTIKDHKRLMDKDIFDEYFKFSVIRNPWDRFASIYKYFIQKGTLAKPGNSKGHGPPFSSFGWEHKKGPIPAGIMKKLVRGNRNKEKLKDYLNISNYTVIEFDEFVERAKDIIDNTEFNPPRGVDRLWPRSQFNFLSIDGELVVDNLIRFENLEEDFYKICNKFGMEKPKIFPHINIQQDTTHYTELYNDTTIKLVEEMFGNDIEYFKYKFK